MRYFLLAMLSFCFTVSAGNEAKAKEFRQGKVSINGHMLNVEIADTPTLHAKGLMFRSSLPEDSGMLFVFGNEDHRSFWMKNTYLPLSIAFFDRKFVLIKIHDMEPASSMMQSNFPHYDSGGPAKYAIEVNRGWFKKNGVSLGSRLKIL